MKSLKGISGWDLPLSLHTCMSPSKSYSYLIKVAISKLENGLASHHLYLQQMPIIMLLTRLQCQLLWSQATCLDDEASLLTDWMAALHKRAK